jgi:hypothetical protein
MVAGFLLASMAHERDGVARPTALVVPCPSWAERRRDRARSAAALLRPAPSPASVSAAAPRVQLLLGVQSAHLPPVRRGFRAAPGLVEELTRWVDGASRTEDDEIRELDLIFSAMVDP